MVKALETGEADRDQDHRISVEELYDYVCEQVREITPNQNPNMLSHLEGELYVARSSYVAPVSPAELPPELRSAIDSPLAGVREGVVSELARLLSGHDPAVAEAARGALRHLADDDSRRVGAAAAAALSVRAQEPPLAESRAPAEQSAIAAPEPVTPAPLTEPAAAVSGPVTPAPAKPVPAPPPGAAETVLAPADATPAATARPAIARWGPLVLSVVGALVVLAALAIFGGALSEGPLGDTEFITGLVTLVAVLIPVLRARGIGWRVVDALEPVLAGVPIGLAAAAGGLQDHIGLYFSPRLVALGGALLLASVLWRQRQEPARPGWPVVAVVVVTSIFVLSSPGSRWWGGETALHLALWPLTVGLYLAAAVAMAGVAVGRWSGGRAWAPLVAAAGGMALWAAVSVRDYTGETGLESHNGLVFALLGGLVFAAAGVYAQLSGRR